MRPILTMQATQAQHYVPRRQPKPAGPSFAFGATLLFALLGVPFLMRVLAALPVS
jgi:hypothetical protein